jgi:chromosome segregation ATPase
VREYAAIFALREKNPARYPLALMGAGDLRMAAATDALRVADAHERELRADLATARAESGRRGEWGHTLDRELGLARQRLEHLHNELDARTHWAHELDAQLRDTQLRHQQLLASHAQLTTSHSQLTASHEQILHSTSWRITAPLRSLNARQRAGQGERHLRRTRRRSHTVRYAEQRYAACLDRDPGLQQDRLHQCLPAFDRRACGRDAVRGDRRR